MDWNDVLHFWFVEHGPRDWFAKSDVFDDEIRRRFSATHSRVEKNETESWRAGIRGRLGEIIVLDQFSRNMFRGTPRAFAYDDFALKLAREAIATGETQKLSPSEKHFLLMPFMHSESVDVHCEAIKLFTDLGNPDALRYEIMHKEIIDRFGRFPHRNKILGRLSTPDEISFLQDHPGF